MMLPEDSFQVNFDDLGGCFENIESFNTRLGWNASPSKIDVQFLLEQMTPKLENEKPGDSPALDVREGQEFGKEIKKEPSPIHSSKAKLEKRKVAPEESATDKLLKPPRKKRGRRPKSASSANEVLTHESAMHTAASTPAGSIASTVTQPTTANVSGSSTPSAMPARILARRRSANARERKRVKDINDGFEMLKKILPDMGEVNPSKVLLLRNTSEYIYQLQKRIKELEQNQQLSERYVYCISLTYLPYIVSKHIHHNL
eukprot:Nk52_evm30s2367 gene=Nk52_evmTU30s2367